MGWSHIHGCEDHSQGIYYCTELFLQVEPGAVLNVCYAFSADAHSIIPQMRHREIKCLIQSHTLGEW